MKLTLEPMQRDILLESMRQRMNGITSWYRPTQRSLSISWWHSRWLDRSAVRCVCCLEQMPNPRFREGIQSLHAWPRFEQQILDVKQMDSKICSANRTLGALNVSRASRRLHGAPGGCDVHTCCTCMHCLSTSSTATVHFWLHLQKNMPSVM